MSGVDCPFYHFDYNRGHEKEACHLLDSSPNVTRPWHRGLCQSCPVPEIQRGTECDHLVLEANIARRWFSDRVEVVFALCTDSMTELENPLRCAACVEHRRTLAD